MGYLTAVG